MPRTAVSETLSLMTAPIDKQPKLVVHGSSSMDGRASTLLRCRSSILKRLSELCACPQYMAFEIAAQLLIAQLEALPPGEMRVISGSSMDATPEDIELLKASGRVVKKTVRKKVQKTDWSDPEKNITNTVE